MNDTRKLSVSNRGTLGAPKSSDGGNVRQNFSHGRSKPVVVERKKRRILTKGAPGQTQQPATPAPEAPAPKSPPEDVSNLSSTEKLARADAVMDAIKQAETERMRAAEDKRIRAESADRQREEDDKIRAEERAREEAEAKMKAEAQARQKAEEDKRLAEEAEAERLAEEARNKVAAKEKDKEKEVEPRFDDEEKSFHKKIDEDKPKGKPVRRDNERRRSGKLTVTRALEGGDEARPRSLAAFKRAQAKKRGAMLNQSAEKKSREVVVPELITVGEFANRMAERAVDVIKILMNMGVMATINESIDQDTAELVAAELGHTIKRVSESDVEIGLVGEADDDKDKKPRAPVITVMGHVDHGKTSLLDALRETEVVAGEAGGITQHIGAYQVHFDDGAVLTFLDTPGHEAFTEMRARGANVTDIVILVVAADDGIMPQTVEAINHAKAAKVPMIIAINKMDRPGADPDRIRQELLQHEVIVEKLSGEVLDVEISALKRQGLDKLKEAIFLQAEMMDIKANPNRTADGVVIEANLDKGRGPVATLLVARGTLRIGDIVVAGGEWGKVRALINDKGVNVDEALPSQPVEILGLSGIPSAGDEFGVVDSESKAREISAYRQAQVKRKRDKASAVSLEDMFSALKENKADEVPIVIKGDVQGSVEAIVSSLAKIGNEEIRARVLHAAVGGITESDVILAQASNAPIIGFNVRANRQARDAAQKEGVTIQYYSVIYDLLDSVKSAMEGKLSPAIDETPIGLAEVKDVFSAGKTGKAAGCIILEGSAKADANARLLRDDVVIFVGKISSLRRFKDEVKEVKAGTECGITFENCVDIKAGDQIEFFETQERARKL